MVVAHLHLSMNLKSYHNIFLVKNCVIIQTKKNLLKRLQKLFMLDFRDQHICFVMRFKKKNLINIFQI